VVAGAAVAPRLRDPKPVLTLGLRRPLLGKGAVGAVAGVLRPLFRPVVVLSVLAALVGVDSWLLVTTSIVRSVEHIIFQPQLLLVVWALTALAGIAHELGHATATRYGGATPGAIGVGIYLFWPAFYNDLNDSYRLNRSGRLRADLGGVYFNGVFIVALAAAYAVTRFEPLLVVIAVQHITVVQQFLPFVRLDGYYVLTDVIGVPDLLARIKPILASLLPGQKPAPSVVELKPSARAAVAVWALLAFEVLAASFAVLAIRSPDVVHIAHDSIVIHAAGFSAALRAGHAWLVLLGAIQLTVLIVPFVGAAVLVVRVLRVSLFRSKAVSTSSTPAPSHHRSALESARMDRVMAFSSARAGAVPLFASFGFAASHSRPPPSS
jgi:putative peptide zinc metalloprotease protein